MNNKIRKLIEKYYGQNGDYSNWSDNQLEELAELIVRQCVYDTAKTKNGSKTIDNEEFSPYNTVNS